jgi:hypothetical protein
MPAYYRQTHTHAQLLAVVGLIPSVHYAGLALVHIFLRDKGEIIDGTKLGVFCFIAGSTGYMNFQLLVYPSLPKARRRWLAVTGTNFQINIYSELCSICNRVLTIKRVSYSHHIFIGINFF